MTEIDVNAGIRALHDRLISEIVKHALVGQGPPVRARATASALSLVLFGHSPFIEGAAQDAVMHAWKNYSQRSTPETVQTDFLAGLPLAMDGLPVREVFFAGTYTHHI